MKPVANDPSVSTVAGKTGSYRKAGAVPGLPRGKKAAGQIQSDAVRDACRREVKEEASASADAGGHERRQASCRDASAMLPGHRFRASHPRLSIAAVSEAIPHAIAAFTHAWSAPLMLVEAA
ncbi:hypothetical protein [Pseudoxanthomonas sp.]|uniref:hypothetical protein n=1 Tax=Pseudoxanthomonas sp. TaxID=1871049 RepID=UPI002582F840|nr:hypothetical protein [Pseudoxanthomonas sp.]MCR6685104.1 hypothetical protein [Pseudoxanthomonas sp.]